MAIAIEVCESETAANARNGEIAAVGCGNILKFSFAEIQKNMGRLGVADIAANVTDSVVDVAVGDDEVQAAIEIEVGKAATEAQRGFGRITNASRDRDVVKLPGGWGTIKADHFVIEIGDGDSGTAGIFEVGDIDSHSSAGLSVRAESKTGFDRSVFELSVAEIAIELVGLSVIGNEEIGPAVLIEVKHGNAERFGTGVKDSAGGGDVFEGAVAAIVKEPAGFAAIGFRSAIGFIFSVEAAEDVMFGGPVDVVADEEVEMAVAVVVEPQRGGAESLASSEAAGLCHVYKGSFAGIAEQAVLADASDQNIREAIVVVIADGDAHAVEFDVESGGAGDIGEGAVAIISIELQRGAIPFVAPPGQGIYGHNGFVRGGGGVEKN